MTADEIIKEFEENLYVDAARVRVLIAEIAALKLAVAKGHDGCRCGC